MSLDTLIDVVLERDPIAYFIRMEVGVPGWRIASGSWCGRYRWLGRRGRGWFWCGRWRLRRRGWSAGITITEHLEYIDKIKVAL